LADEQDPPVFAFDGTWPFTGTPDINGHPVASVTSFTVRADEGGIPSVTVTLVGPDALRLLLGSARVQVSDETAEALESLGWKPPAGAR
jgi:hypothetical protein